MRPSGNQRNVQKVGKHIWKQSCYENPSNKTCPHNLLDQIWKNLHVWALGSKTAAQPLLNPGSTPSQGHFLMPSHFPKSWSKSFVLPRMLLLGGCERELCERLEGLREGLSRFRCVPRRHHRKPAFPWRGQQKGTCGEHIDISFFHASNKCFCVHVSCLQRRSTQSAWSWNVAALVAKLRSISRSAWWSTYLGIHLDNPHIEIPRCGS